MEHTDHMANREAETTQQVLDLLCANSRDLPSGIAAGALMRASVLLVVDLIGRERAADTCRAALENVLRDHTGTTQ